MEILLAFGVMSLISLGVISVGEMIVRSLKTRSSEPLNYDGVGDAIGSGLSGFEPSDTSHFFGSIGSHIVHFFGHFFHH
ncbi:hypothetical protein [Leptolyngbya sp. NIES-2104]|uniref:hypothetical protein n=1 Tax=Leptolyngbya sp. NIES-2104 TaxID=1552121 RepID=UPI0006ECA089|nr:hypothetical protein [Leptolyngbya sp. NIES-2104]GAP97877.1 hypothetical protein NIES2104_44290 [Leptolyngbya sp. NIES-2104]